MISNRGGKCYLDLSLHGNAEQSDEVHDKDRPEHGDIKHLWKEKGLEMSVNNLGRTKPEHFSLP